MFYFLSFSCFPRSCSFSILHPCFSPMNFKFLLCLELIKAARETGALQAAKNKLEKQVEELTWRLQLEKRMRVSVKIQFLWFFNCLW